MGRKTVGGKHKNSPHTIALYPRHTSYPSQADTVFLGHPTEAEKGS